MLEPLAALALGAALSLQPASATPLDDPPDRAPGEGGEVSVVYQAKSEGGLRYTWLLPEGYESGVARDVTVILHGTGLDYRWGHWNHPTGVLRPDDIVVSVDGTSPDGEARLFLGNSADAEAFKAFLDELRGLFVVDQVFLYGHSQGGFFAIYFAGEFPDAIDGAVAHASGAWNWSKMGRDVQRVPLAFMHGTRDPVVPYRQSPASRDAYAEKGFELLHLRRLQNYNHWPNAVRANEVLGWCDGMSTEDPEEALAEALAILRKKRPDQYQYESAVDYAGARDVLRRLVGEGPRPFKEVDAKTEREAKRWIAAIEEEGKRHVSKLKKSVAKKKDLRLGEGEWLGHLLAVREDFRGVDAVEAYVKKLGFDGVFEKQEKARAAILEAYYEEKDSTKQFETIVLELSKGFLFEGYPPELAERLEKLRGAGDKKDFSKKALAAFEEFEHWREALEKGYAEYASIWKKWDGPEAD